MAVEDYSEGPAAGESPEAQVSETGMQRRGAGVPSASSAFADPDTERAVVAALLIEPSCIATVLTVLGGLSAPETGMQKKKSGDVDALRKSAFHSQALMIFYDPKLAVIYEAILELAEKMKADVMKIKGEGDTAGGIIECIAHGVPAGLGEPVFDKMSALLAHAVCSIGAIKGIEFGAGFEVANMLGSQSNDAAYVDPESGKVRFRTNHAGGILGGITTWEDIRFRCAVKPTPTVSVPQHTVNVKEMKDVVLSPITRRDPTLLPRIYPVIEAMTRCVLLDAIYMAEAYWKVSGIDEKWRRI